MSYKAIVTQLNDLKPHPNADRVQLANCQANQVVVGISHQVGDLGVYFPSDGQLSEEFCSINNLFRESDFNSDKNTKSGFFDSNRRVRAQKFRGEISDGFWMPISVFKNYNDENLNTVGYEFDSLDGSKICNKYINVATIEQSKKQKVLKSAKRSIMFKEHFDTEHFGKSLDQFNNGDHIIITEKLHGTSGRIGNVKVERDLNWFEKFLTKVGVSIDKYEWKYLNGSRRVVLEESTGKQFHDPTIREKAFELFNNKLKKSETVYFEIVGFESNGVPIMPIVNTKSLNDKEFTKKYGENMIYSYGCNEKDSDIYVYRITSTNEDGETLDYSWSDVVKRCAELGVKTVPEISNFIIGDSNKISEQWQELIPYFANGESSLDSNHISEGVCIRVEGGLNNRTFKYKSFEFKVLEGIVKDSGQIDQEEAQSI